MVTGNSIAEWSKGKGLLAYKRAAAAGESKEKIISCTEKKKGERKVAWQGRKVGSCCRERVACCFPVQEGQKAEAQA